MHRREAITHRVEHGVEHGLGNDGVRYNLMPIDCPQGRDRTHALPKEHDAGMGELFGRILESRGHIVCLAHTDGGVGFRRASGTPEIYEQDRGAKSK